MLLDRAFLSQLGQLVAVDYSINVLENRYNLWATNLSKMNLFQRRNGRHSYILDIEVHIIWMIGCVLLFRSLLMDPVYRNGNVSFLTTNIESVSASGYNMVQL